MPGKPFDRDDSHLIGPHVVELLHDARNNGVRLSEADAALQLNEQNRSALLNT